MQRLRAFLATKNPDAARRAGAAILGGLRLLASHPRLGRPVDDLPEQYRDWLIEFGDSGYLARYRLDAGRVTILAIRHLKEAGF
ncbi:type II toxin-antitoxin system RelE/ParE family toxin [Azorhizobium doebereinerae]|uniref:type II toxin-antitoxin system RelE/ParE family toxin n=1 Tax=Azorhizobium doebereinerae TaxID=281091 RepID=UPI003CC91DA6